MKFNYLSKTDKREATMLLYDSIGSEGINGAQFASELTWVANSGQFDLIKLRINCEGGSVIKGMSIFSAVINSPVPVYTYIDYLAASMGGVIALAGKKCYMAVNGLLMVHPPFNPDGEDSAKEREVISKIKESLVSVFTSKTGKSDSVITQMMDAETWMNATEAKSYGFIDGVFDSLVKPKTLSREASFVHKISAQLKTQMDTPIELEALKNELDKLKASVSEQKKETETLKAENEALKKSLEAKEKELSDKREKEAVELVENAIKDGKVKKESRESLIESAKKDFTMVKNTIDGLQLNTVARLSNVAGSGKKESDTVGERKDWTIRDWEKKDPKALFKMKTEQPEQYKELYDQTYSK